LPASGGPLERVMGTLIRRHWGTPGGKYLARWGFTTQNLIFWSPISMAACLDHPGTELC
jgi:hypothetical protein